MIVPWRWQIVPVPREALDQTTADAGYAAWGARWQEAGGATAR